VDCLAMVPIASWLSQWISFCCCGLTWRDSGNSCTKYRTTSSGASRFMHSVEEAFHHCWSTAETRGILAPNTGRVPAVPRSDVNSVKISFRYCWSSGETRGTLAPNTEQRPALPLCYMQDVKEKLHYCWSPAETRGPLAPNTERPAVPD
jgi:hypothetical protein